MRGEDLSADFQVRKSSWRAHVSGKKAASGAADNAERHGNSLSNKYTERLVELYRADAVL
jgi:hypothetical protein